MEIQDLLNKLGGQIKTPTRLYLIGGSALALLGSPRQTIDIDFIGNDILPTSEHEALLKTAKELDILLEPVPLEQFIPLPENSDKRSIRIGKFNNLEIYVADPYSIALGKLDRGFDTDIEDIIFLLQKHYIEIEKLNLITETALSQANKYDLNATEILDHLQVVRERLK